MSLREMPSGQQVRSTRWRRIRYIPLTVLLIVVIGAAVVGAVAAPSHPAQRVEVQPRAAGLTPATSSAAADRALPSACHPSVASTSHETWMGSEVAQAEAQRVWDTHREELATPAFTEEGGWADWGDVQAANISQAVGKRLLTTAEADRWYAYLDNLRDRLEAKGIPFYVLVAPAKWDVYPERLPPWAQRIKGPGPLDQLLARHPDLPIIDVRSALRSAKADHSVYSATNPHWTDYGAWVAWNAVASCLDAAANGPSVPSAPPISGVDVEAQRNEFTAFGVPSGAPDWTVPRYDEPLLPVTVTKASGTASVDPTANLDMLDLPAATRTPDAASKKKLLLARDSFGNALAVPVDQVFAATYQIRHNLDSAPDKQPDIAAAAIKEHADIVILEVTQRYLGLVPQG